MKWLLLLLLIACAPMETENGSMETVQIEEIEENEEIEKNVTTVNVAYADFTVKTLKLLEQKEGYWKYEYHKNGDYIIVEKKRLDGVEYWQVASGYFGEYEYDTRTDVQKALDIIQLGNKELVEKQEMLKEFTVQLY